MLVRIVNGIAVLATGLLSGAFGYGAANLAPTFWAVPLDLRLTFHIELMKMNGIVMQAAMGLAAVSSLALAVLLRGTPRLVAAAASALTVTSFLVTRFGNVPINQQMRDWVATSPPADHVEILQRWDMFNYLRTATAIIAFGLLITLTLRQRRAEAESRPG